MFARRTVSRISIAAAAATVLVLSYVILPHARFTIADSTGPVSPTIVSEGLIGGIAVWDENADLNNILASDDVRTDSGLMGAGEFSNSLRARGFDFSGIPDTATILGIEVSIEKSASVSGAIADRAVRLFSSNGLSVDNKADVVTAWGTDDQVIVYGGTSDLWGSTWTVSDVKSGFFSVAFLAQNVGSEHAQALVDHIAVTVTYVDNPETIQPTVTISSVGTPQPTNSSPIPVSIEFSEPVVGFEESDIVISGAAMANFVAASSTFYTFDAVPSSDPSTVTIDIPEGAVTDLAGNVNMAATQFSHGYDSLVPSISIVGGPSEGDVITDTAVSFQFETGGEFAACALNVEPTIGSNDCTSFIPPTGTHELSSLSSGEYVLFIKVSASTTSEVLFARSFVIDVDRSLPTISSNAVISGWASSSPVQLGVVFSDPVSGFDDLVSDISASGGVMHDLVGQGTSYVVSITPTSGGVSVSIPEGVATETNGSGWTNVASSVFTFSYDAVAPSFTLLSAPQHGVATSSNTVVLDLEASDDNGFTIFCTLDDVPVACVMPHTFSALVDGNHTLFFEVSDPAGNATSSTISFTVDTIAPVVTEVVPVGTSTDSTPEYSFASTEEGSVSVSGSCSAEPVSIASGTSTIAFNALSPGTYTDCIVAVTDVAGNTSAPLAVSPFTIEIEAEEPAEVLISNGPPVVAAVTPSGQVLGAFTGNVQTSNAPEAMQVHTTSAQTVSPLVTNPVPYEEIVEVSDEKESVPGYVQTGLEGAPLSTDDAYTPHAAAVNASGATMPIWAMALVVLVLSALGWGLLWRFVR